MSDLKCDIVKKIGVRPAPMLASSEENRSLPSPNFWGSPKGGYARSGMTIALIDNRGEGQRRQIEI